MPKKTPEITEAEETVQRALGTLPKFEVAVEREVTRKSFARILVTASSKEAAESRALKIVKEDAEDDTGRKPSWSNNQEGDVGETVPESVRQLEEDDYLIHRFDKKSKDEKDPLDYVGPASLGTVI